MTCRTKKLMLAHALTTYEDSYKGHKITELPKRYKKPWEHPQKQKPQKKQSRVVNCVHTLTPFSKYLPFDTYHLPKDITRTDPRAEFDTEVSGWFFNFFN